MSEPPRPLASETRERLTRLVKFLRSTRTLSKAPWPAGEAWSGIVEAFDERGLAHETLAEDIARLMTACDESVNALKALIAVRPFNWDDEVDDPEGYRAWRNAEDLLRRLGELP